VIAVHGDPAAGWWERVEPTGGLLLRRPCADDAAGVLAVHGDPAVYAYDPAETHSDLAHSARFLAPMLDHWSRHGFGYWSLLVPPSLWPEGEAGAMAGDGERVFAGLGGIQHHTLDGVPVLNTYYRFGTAVQGRGLAGVLLGLVLRLAPEVAPGADVVVRTRPANGVARRVAERAGFVDEGLEPGTSDMQLLRFPAGRLAAD
jgi:[ribosomal protein S5]-alanine N-acetyltransferase